MRSNRPATTSLELFIPLTESIFKHWDTSKFDSKILNLVTLEYKRDQVYDQAEYVY